MKKEYELTRFVVEVTMHDGEVCRVPPCNVMNTLAEKGGSLPEIIFAYIWDNFSLEQQKAMTDGLNAYCRHPSGPLTIRTETVKFKV
jgi:hypothetical protein